MRGFGGLSREAISSFRGEKGVKYEPCVCVCVEGNTVWEDIRVDPVYFAKWSVRSFACAPQS